MALLPPTRNHTESAAALLENMEPTWKGGCIVRIMESRLARFEGNLAMATDALSNHSLDMNLRGLNLRLRNLMLEEMGWCLMLQGHYDKAAMCFDSLFKVTPPSPRVTCSKPLHCFNPYFRERNLQAHTSEFTLVVRSIWQLSIQIYSFCFNIK